MGNIYIETDDDFRVTKIHRMPFDPNQGMGYTREELEKKGYFVDEILEPVHQVGRRSIAMYNPDTKSVYYESVGIPMSDKERLDEIEAAMNSLLLLQSMQTPMMARSYRMEDRCDDNQETEEDELMRSINKNIGSYLAHQILSGVIDTEKCLELYPQFSMNIREVLMENGVQA